MSSTNARICDPALSAFFKSVLRISRRNVLGSASSLSVSASQFSWRTELTHQKEVTWTRFLSGSFCGIFPDVPTPLLTSEWQPCGRSKGSFDSRVASCASGSKFSWCHKMESNLQPQPPEADGNVIAFADISTSTKIFWFQVFFDWWCNKGQSEAITRVIPIHGQHFLESRHGWWCWARGLDPKAKDSEAAG